MTFVPNSPTNDPAVIQCILLSAHSNIVPVYQSLLFAFKALKLRMKGSTQKQLPYFSAGRGFRKSLSLAHS